MLKLSFLSVFIKIFLVSFLAVTALNANKDKAVMAIVDVNWLQQNINNPNLQIVDLRPESDFANGHVKGAVNIDAYKKLFAQGYMMPGLEELRVLFSKSGIDSNTHVVAYDDGSFIWAARLYWVLETLGHTNVSILNIGFNHSNIKNLPISTQAIIPKSKDFVPRVDDAKLQTKLGTLVSIGNKTIIDGRKETHYIGKESLAKRYGHIPTAQHYPCTQNYEVSSEGNQMRKLDDLATVYKDLPKDKEIILYCDGGAEAALNYLVLQELGYKASVYDGSWVEWGNDPIVPIENPSIGK